MKHHLAFELQQTDDGSATIFLPGMDEHYHSVRGALSESRHIYRDCAFMHRSGAGGMLTLLEVGFGTGLNAVVTAMAADARHRVHYIALEKFPVGRDVIEALGYGSIVDACLLDMIHDASWNRIVEITPYFTIEKRLCDYTVDELPAGVDVVYFDAFAPEKQPDMWSPRAFERLVTVMNSGAVLATYCAKGEIRRQMQALGLVVERLAGPPGGKREILRATKP